MKPTTSLHTFADRAAGDRKITPEELLALIRPAGSLVEVIDNQDELLLRLRIVENNCKLIIRLCVDELEDLPRKNDPELHDALSGTKKLATEALQIAQNAIRGKDLRGSRHMKLLQQKYDSLDGSIGRIFLLIASPHLALRAEGAL